MVVDNRLKVRHKDGRVGVVEKMLTRDYCSVQFIRDGYYVVCKEADLDPISEQEFIKHFGRRR